MYPHKKAGEPLKQAIRVAFGVTALRVGIAGAGIDGIGHYTKSLKKELASRSELELLEYAYEATSAERTHSSAVHPVGSFQRQAALSLLSGTSFDGFRALRRTRIDLIHATDHQVPKVRSVPVVATLMDAIPLSNPEWVNFGRAKAIAWRRSMHWADRIITISEYSRAAIVRHFGIPSDKIDVVPLGVDRKWFEAPPREVAELTRARYKMPERYLLFVGTLQPRKNLERLLRAHASLPSSVKAANPLVIAGRNGWGVDHLVGQLKKESIPHVRWLEYVSDKDLQVLVSAARALAFPSLAEGFGLPVLEAFAAGTAVIASNATSVPEVAGDAALLVDPERVDALSDALRMVSGDDELVQSLEFDGRERAKLFTWENTAAQTLECYKKVL